MLIVVMSSCCYFDIIVLIIKDESFITCNVLCAKTNSLLINASKGFFESYIVIRI